MAEKVRNAGKYVFFATSLILLLLHLSVWIQDNHAFTVRKIMVSGNNLLEEAELLELARVDTVGSIWNTEVKRIEERIAELPEIAKVEVARTFPSSIRVRVQEREPVAVLLDNGLWGLDREGVLLPRFKPKVGMDYPVIVGLRLKQHLPGEVVDNENVARLAGFLGDLQKANSFVYHLISEATYTETNGVQFLTTEEQLPVILGGGGWVKKCKKLGAAWRHFQTTKKLENVARLDLRFDEQIVLKRKT